MPFDRFASVEFTTPEGLGWLVNPVSSGPLANTTPLLTVTFDVVKTIEPKPAKASISVYNLSESQRGRLTLLRPSMDDFDLPTAFMDRRLRGPGAGVGAKFTAQAVNRGYVELRAGYDTAAPQIFEGLVDDARNVKDGGHTWISQIYASDGAVNILAGECNRAFPKNTPVLTILRYLAETANLELAADVDPEKGGTLPAEAGGAVISTTFCDGAPEILLTQIARGSNFGWFVDDGEVVIVGPSGFRSTSTLTVKPRDIIGQPVRVGPDQLRLVTELKPQAKLGGPCQLTSREISGRFRIDGLRHRGSIFGGDYQTILDLRNLDVLQTL